MTTFVRYVFVGRALHFSSHRVTLSYVGDAARQVWFVLAESIASACYGVARHVGERLAPKQICGSFEMMYKIFFKYLDTADQQKHFRFAYVWNEVGSGERFLWDTMHGARLASLGLVDARRGVMFTCVRPGER